MAESPLTAQCQISSGFIADTAIWNVDTVSSRGVSSAPPQPQLNLDSTIQLKKDLVSALQDRTWSSTILFSAREAPESIRELAMLLTVREEGASAVLTNGAQLLVLPYMLTKAAQVRTILNNAAVPVLPDSAVTKGVHLLVGYIFDSPTAIQDSVAPAAEGAQTSPNTSSGLPAESCAARAVASFEVLKNLEELTTSTTVLPVLKALLCLAALDRCDDPVQ